MSKKIIVQIKTSLMTTNNIFVFCFLSDILSFVHQKAFVLE